MTTKWSRRLLGIGGALVMAATAAAQSGPFAGLKWQKQTPPDSVLYQALFARFNRQEQIATQMDGKGTQSAAAAKGERRRLRTDIGLSANEDTALKAIAADYGTTHTAYIQQRKQFAKDHPLRPGDPSSQAAVVQWAPTAQQDRDNLAAHMARVRQTLGEKRFQLLDAWVHTKLAPAITYKVGKMTVGAPK